MQELIEREINGFFVTGIKDFRKKIMAFEEQLKKVPGALEGHENDETFLPLKHKFVDGAYVREIFMPKGTLLTSKIHKFRHPYFVMSGECSVLTEAGAKRIKAPYAGITEPGTKRIIYVHEDTVWITTHVTDETDLEKIEDYIIAKTYDDPAVCLIEENTLKIGGSK